MNKKISLVILLALMFVVNHRIYGQSYFKVSEMSNDYYNHRITHFPNGDLLIGDSSLEALKTGKETGKIVLTRLDSCGNVLWSSSYFLTEGYLEFKDFRINESGEIFAYGSFYKGLEEFIFLFKTNGDNGESIDFGLYDPGTVDHFSYSMDLRDGQLMIYGLILDFNTQKQGFVAVFNENLVFQWAKQFAPFESSGDAINSNDKGFIGRSGEYLIKLDPNGALEWASYLEAGISSQTISGPIEVSDGFILESNQNDLSFFYKVDRLGTLVWKSAQFSASMFGSTMSLLPNGNLLCTYNCPSGALTQLCQLMMSPDGQIFNQRRLVFGSLLNTGVLYQSINELNIIAIAGNANPFSVTEVDIKDFILKFPLDDLPEDCFFWEDFEEKILNNIDLSFSFYDFTPISFEMDLVKKIKMEAVVFSSPYKEICNEIIDANSLEIDTFLSCEKDWLVSLPAPDYIWLDDTPENPRLISIPGTYQAKKLSCINPITVNYTLEKPNCGCPVYLPNAFSPNRDGVNDNLNFFSNCTLDSFEMEVFNRWGERVFYSESLNYFWNGTYQQKIAAMGVYFVMVKYAWKDFDGSLQQGSLFKDVTLLR